MRFTDVVRDAWPRIRKANSFNEPPPKGYQDVMAFMEWEYTGEGRADLMPSGVVKAVGDSGVEYTTFSEPTCGVVPQPNAVIGSPTLRTGGKAKGWLCWTVAKEDVKDLRLFVEFFLDEESYTEFALR